MSFGSLLLAVSFVFGNAAKNLFEGVLFLFSQHPFDVGMKFALSFAADNGQEGLKHV